VSYLLLQEAEIKVGLCGVQIGHSPLAENILEEVNFFCSRIVRSLLILLDFTDNFLNNRSLYLSLRNYSLEVWRLRTESSVNPVLI